MARPPETDTAFRVQTPEGIEYLLYPAGLSIRLFAYVIDTLFQTLLLLGMFIVFSLVLRRFAGIWLILLCHFVLEWFYHVFWELLNRGQSPGKRFLGLRVVRSDGNPVGAGASLIRNLLRFADSFPGLYFAAFLSVIASKGFRRPGDWAAGTLVIYTWQSQTPDPGARMDWLASIPPAAPERPLSSEEKQGLLMFARRYPLLGPARAEEIARPMAASLRSGSAEPAHNSAGFLLGITRAFAGDTQGDKAP
jgi:uncharacterized RDD family membrane protein YckC